MNKKATIIAVIMLFAIQLVSLLILDMKYSLEYGTYVQNHLKYYFMIIIFYAVLNDALIFTIGILIYYKKTIMKSRITSICAGLLLLSIVLVVVSGLYYGFTIDYGLVNPNFYKNINNFMNIFYVMYMICFTLFVLISFKVKLFSDRLPRILLLLLFTIMIFVYFRQSTYYGFISRWVYIPNILRSIRQGIVYIILYPASIAAFIVSTLILVKNQGEYGRIE